jgi:hypothetical protein
MLATACGFSFLRCSRIGARSCDRSFAQQPLDCPDLIRQLLLHRGSEGFRPGALNAMCGRQKLYHAKNSASAAWRAGALVSMDTGSDCAEWREWISDPVSILEGLANAPDFSPEEQRLAKRRVVNQPIHRRVGRVA